MSVLSNFKFPHIGLISAPLILTLIGLLISSVVSPAEFDFQWKVALVSIITALLISQVDSEIFYLLSKPLYLLILILLILLLVLNDPIRGSRRWVNIGPLVIQVSEFAKLALILFMASISSKIKIKKFSHFLVAGLYILIPFVLVFLQPDLGSSLVLMLSGLLSLSAQKVKMQHFVFIGIIFLASLPLIATLLAPYQKARVEHFLNPGKDPLGASYNQIQAVIAAGSGQFIGKGLGKGTQSRLEFLPEKQTDFFFATAAEQLGFMGSIIIVFAYVYMGWNLVSIAGSVKTNPAKVMMLGSLGLLFFQPVIHIGINLGILPVTGIPLPFMSVGGSSLMVSWLTIGIIAAIEKDNRERKAFEIG